MATGSTADGVRSEQALLGIYLNGHLAVTPAASSWRGGRLHPIGVRYWGEARAFCCRCGRRPYCAAEHDGRARPAGQAVQGLCSMGGREGGGLKLNGSLWSRSPLSGVVELEILRLDVEGIAAAWRTLRARAERDTRLDKEQLNELLSRAARQSEAWRSFGPLPRPGLYPCFRPSWQHQAGWTAPACPGPREARDTRASCGAAGQAAMAWLRDVRRWRSARSWVA
jgi:hypothetical protein